MVADPGAKVRAHRLRPLASPQRLRVETDGAGRPRALLHEGAMRTVVAVQDHWRIDDEWWRETPVSRMYYRVQLEGGRGVTVYRDLHAGEWRLQRY